jgi:hypothetical protein
MAKSLKLRMKEDLLAGLRGFIQNALAKAKQNPDGTITISKDNVSKWQRVLDGPLKTAPKHMQEWTESTANRMIKTIKDFKKETIAKTEVEDPRVKEVKDAFIEYCKDIRDLDYRPDNRKDVPLIKKRLAEGHSADLLKDAFDWFLKDDVSHRLPPTISVALSSGVFTQFMSKR